MRFMRHITVTAAIALSLAMGIAAVATYPVMATQSRGEHANLDATLAQVDAAQTELIHGHPEPFKALWSHRDDVTLVGGLGGAIAKGWPGVSERLNWVSTQYPESSRTHQEVSRVVGQELAYVVQRETIRFRVAGQAEPSTQEQRATMVFRREGSAWRI